MQRRSFLKLLGPAIALALEARHQEREIAAARARVVKAGKSHGEITDSVPTAEDKTYNGPFNMARLELARHDVWGSDVEP